MTRTALRRLGAAAVVLGLAFCLILPGILCRAWTAALEGRTLARPTLEVELDAAGRDDPLALALYQARTLYGSGGAAQELPLGQDAVSGQLAQAVGQLAAAGVLDETEAGLAGELLASTPETAQASRSRDSTLEYRWQVYLPGYALVMTRHPDLEQPLSLSVKHSTLPEADPAALLERWMAFLGEDDGLDDWQYTTGLLQGVAAAWSPARQLLLTACAAEGQRAVRAYSVSPQDYPDLLEDMAAAEQGRQEREAWQQDIGREAEP